MLISFAIAAGFGGLGIVLSVIGYFLFDLVEWRIDFADEIKKGNVAAALVMGLFILGICFIIGRAIGS
ncbi:MAG: DUF350 domain-containing protein [Planctomycetes bacterium]|nr:DUF350 domain-containing protein [Planctomycetota bacterium]